MRIFWKWKRGNGERNDSQIEFLVGGQWVAFNVVLRWKNLPAKVIIIIIVSSFPFFFTKNSQFLFSRLQTSATKIPISSFIPFPKKVRIGPAHACTKSQPNPYLFASKSPNPLLCKKFNQTGLFEYTYLATICPPDSQNQPKPILPPFSEKFGLFMSSRPTGFAFQKKYWFPPPSDKRENPFSVSRIAMVKRAQWNLCSVHRTWFRKTAQLFSFFPFFLSLIFGRTGNRKLFFSSGAVWEDPKKKGRPVGHIIKRKGPKGRNAAISLFLSLSLASPLPKIALIPTLFRPSPPNPSVPPLPNPSPPPPNKHQVPHDQIAPFPNRRASGRGWRNRKKRKRKLNWCRRRGGERTGSER